MSRWIDLEGGVRVRSSARYAMNSVLLLHPEHAIVVDPGILPSELDELATVVAAARPAALTLVFTHAHWDHVLGRPWWPEAETLGHDGLARALREERARIEAEARRVAEEAGEPWPRPFEPFRPNHAVSGLHFRKIGPWRLVIRSAPGHCDSQINVHVPDLGLLIAADMLSDLEIPGLDRPPDVYRKSLDALLPIAHGGAIETLIPGHGAIARGRDAVLARMRADYDYLDAIERGARQARAEGLTVEMTVERLAAMEYSGKRATEYPTVEVHRHNVGLAYASAAALEA